MPLGAQNTRVKDLDAFRLVKHESKGPGPVEHEGKGTCGCTQMLHFMHYESLFLIEHDGEGTRCLLQEDVRGFWMI